MIRSLIRAFALLSILKSKRGEWEYLSSENSFKRLLAYKTVKRHHLRLKQLIRLANRRRPRRWHVRPTLAGHKVYGAWYSLIPIMREYDRDEFFNHKDKVVLLQNYKGIIP